MVPHELDAEQQAAIARIHERCAQQQEKHNHQQLDGAPTATLLSVSSASMLRSRIAARDLDCLRFVQVGDWRSAEELAARCLKQEETCLKAQLQEIEVLSEIFSKEMIVSDTSPLMVIVRVALESIDCQIELCFCLPSLYPLLAAPFISSYVPFPFNELLDHSSSAGSPSRSLQSVLESTASTLIGEEAGSLYSLIDAARGWIDDRAHLFASHAPSASPALPSERPYRALYESLNTEKVTLTTRQRIEAQIQKVLDDTVDKCGVSRAKAKALLREHQWRPDLVPVTKSAHAPLTSSASASVDGSFTDRLLPVLSKLLLEDSLFDCLACCETCQAREGCLMLCCAEMHFLCFACYASYLSSLLHSGDCFVKCPGHKCQQFVSESLIFALHSERDFSRYRRFIQDSMIALQQSKWCANERCTYVAQIEPQYITASTTSSTLSAAPLNLITSHVVACSCQALYCFSCQEHAHWPLLCGERSKYYTSRVIQGLRKKHEVLSKLQERLQDEALVVTTKPCPSCKTKWERVEGCNHIKCAKCNFHFCYVCLLPWSQHGVEWYDCPFLQYEKAASKQVFVEHDDLYNDSTGVNSNNVGFMLQLIGKECDSTNNVARALVIKGNANHEMDSLSSAVAAADHQISIALGAPKPSTASSMDHLNLRAPISSLLETLIAVHSLMQHCFIAMTARTKRLALISPKAEFWQTLNRFEYFLDVLNSSLLRHDLPVGVRIVRCLEQLLDTERSMIKFARLFLIELREFLLDDLASELRAKEEAAAIAADSIVAAPSQPVDPVAPGTLREIGSFFARLDRSSGKAPKTGAEQLLDVVPPWLF